MRAASGEAADCAASVSTIYWRQQMKALIAILFGASFLLAGCNTMEGIGKDVKAGGQKVESEAKEHKRY
jgi:entericidin B